MKSILKTNFSKCFCSLYLLTLAIAITSCQNQQNTTNPPIATPSPTESPVTESPASPVVSSSETMVIDDFENNKGINKQGGGWYSYDDKGSGGDSKVSPFQPVSEGANNSKYSALLKGNITPTYKYGYIGMGTNLTADGKPIDITQYKGIKFCAKGDNGKYYFKFHSQAIPDYNDYVHVFTATPQWECQQVLFTDMKQLDLNKPVDLQKALAEAVSIQFQTAEQPPKSVELAVDDLEFFK